MYMTTETFHYSPTSLRGKSPSHFICNNMTLFTLMWNLIQIFSHFLYYKTATATTTTMTSTVPASNGLHPHCRQTFVSTAKADPLRIPFRHSATRSHIENVCTLSYVLLLLDYFNYNVRNNYNCNCSCSWKCEMVRTEKQTKYTDEIQNDIKVLKCTTCKRIRVQRCSFILECMKNLTKKEYLH